MTPAEVAAAGEGSGARSIRSTAFPGAGSLRLQLRRSVVAGTILVTLPVFCAALVGARTLLDRGEGILLIALSACSISAGLLIIRRALRSVRKEAQDSRRSERRRCRLGRH